MTFLVCSITNIYSKKFTIGYGCDLFIVLSNFYIGFGVIIFSKLNVVSFVEVYRKQICIYPFIGTVESSSCVNSKVTFVWTCDQ